MKYSMHHRWLLAALALACFTATGSGDQVDTSRLLPYGPEMEGFRKRHCEDLIEASRD